MILALASSFSNFLEIHLLYLHIITILCLEILTWVDFTLICIRSVLLIINREVLRS